METGEDLQAPHTVRGLQTALHAKAKGDPGFRFYTLSDKVWRADVLAAAWQAVRRNGGACGVDGETFEQSKERDVQRWLGELAEELRRNTDRPRAVRQVLIPKKQPGEFRPLGIPCIRDRVAHPSLEFWPGSQLESLAESPWTGLFSPNNRLHSVLLAWILRLFPFFGVSCSMC